MPPSPSTGGRKKLDDSYNGLFLLHLNPSVSDNVRRKTKQNKKKKTLEHGYNKIHMLIGK